MRETTKNRHLVSLITELFLGLLVDAHDFDSHTSDLEFS